jgi:hypothetical protein
MAFFMQKGMVQSQAFVTTTWLARLENYNY